MQGYRFGKLFSVYLLTPPVVRYRTARIHNRRAVHTVQLTSHPPVLSTIRELHSRAVHTVQLIIHPPLFPPVSVLNRRTIHTVLLAVHKPIFSTILVLHSRPTHTVALAIHVPLINAIRSLHSRTIIAVQRATRHTTNMPLFSAVGPLNHRRHHSRRNLSMTTNIP